jgi:hypothetical protein
VKGVPDVVCECAASRIDGGRREFTGHWLTLATQNVAAAAPTTGVLPAAADQVSALTAAQFSTHAEMYQAISAQAAAIHEIFVNTLGVSGGSYAATEAANAAAAV